MWLNQVSYRMYCLHLKWLYSKNSLRIFKFSISLLVPSGLERKIIGEIDPPFSCSVYSITPLPTSLLIPTITFYDAWPLITLLFWLGSSCWKSNFNPSTVFKISLSDVIFSHSGILLEIQPPLKVLIFFLRYVFNFGQKSSNLLTFLVNAVNISWIWRSSETVLFSMNMSFFGLGSLKTVGF